MTILLLRHAKLMKMHSSPFFFLATTMGAHKPVAQSSQLPGALLFFPAVLCSVDQDARAQASSWQNFLAEFFHSMTFLLLSGKRSERLERSRNGQWPAN